MSRMRPSGMSCSCPGSRRAAAMLRMNIWVINSALARLRSTAHRRCGWHIVRRPGVLHLLAGPPPLDGGASSPLRHTFGWAISHIAGTCPSRPAHHLRAQLQAVQSLYRGACGTESVPTRCRCGPRPAPRPLAAILSAHEGLTPRRHPRSGSSSKGLNALLSGFSLRLVSCRPRTCVEHGPVNHGPRAINRRQGRSWSARGHGSSPSAPLCGAAGRSAPLLPSCLQPFAGCQLGRARARAPL